MKDSGIEWIGEIPTDWELCKLKRLIKRVVGGIWGDEAQGDSNDVPCVRVIDFDRNNFKVKNVGFTVINLDKDRQRQYLLRQGDLLIEKSGGGEQQPVGFVVQYDLDMPAIYTNFIAKMEMNNYLTNSNFLKYIFATLYFQGINTRSIKQTTGIQNIDIDSYMDEIIALPPLTEQQRIANYLDQKVAQVDYIIKKTKEYIEEYKKYKQSLITEVVTKGLNPNIEMKDSGIEWIGRIPKHWEVKKINSLFKKIGSGTTPNSNTIEYYDGDHFWIQSGDIKGEYITSTTKKVTSLALNNISTLKKYKPDFIVIAMYGASIGNIAISNIQACVNQACCVLSEPLINLYYAFYCMIASKNHLLTLASGGTQPNISQEIIKQTRLPIPSAHEQQKIVDYLKNKCSEIETIIIEREKQISELESYKKSLIYEYITGKKQVM